MKLLNDHPTDDVSTLLAQIEVRSSVYCLSELGAPWGFRVEGRDVAKFHLALEGEAQLIVDGREPVPVGAGDLVLLPHGEAHEMVDAPGRAVERLDRILLDHPVDGQARMHYGGGGVTTRLLCGGFSLDALPEALRPLLPEVIRLDAASARITPWLEPMFGLLESETAKSEPGARAVFAKIADIFLTQALRSFLVGIEDGGLLGLRPLLDPEIGRACGLIHADPIRGWSVPELAREVGLSRSAFSPRFREAVGEPPARYLTRVRLSRAAGYLVTTDMTVAAVAEATGYESDESLSKAFKRIYGVAPGAYRRDAAGRPLLSAVETAA